MLETMNTPVLATPGQINYLRSLAQQRALFGTELGVEATIKKMDEMLAAGLTKLAASALIDSAAKAERWGDAAPATDGLLNSARYRARSLAVYGLTVSPEEASDRLEAAIAKGMTVGNVKALLRSWWNAKPYPTAKSPLPLSSIDGIDPIAVPEGSFAVMNDAELRFYRVYVPNTGEFEGQPVIRRYASDNLLALYPAEARNAIDAILVDPYRAAYRFSDEHTRCYVCTRMLTDSVSRMLSIGPDCRGFASHSGLKQAARDVDADPTRRAVYRQFRAWAVSQGFRDPRNKDERSQLAGQMTAARFAAAWSGLPGVLNLPDPVSTIQESMNGGDLPATIADMLTSAAPDTVLDVIATGVLPQPVLMLLLAHPSNKVREAASQFMTDLLVQ